MGTNIEAANRWTLWVSWALIVLNAAACLYGVIGGENFEDAFEEEGFTTTISFLQLLFLAVLAAALFLLERRYITSDTPRRRAALFWGLASPGFLYLALDDEFMIHENIDFKIHDLLQMKETAWSDQIDTGILILAALIGFILFVKFYARLKLSRRVALFFWGGFALLGGSELLDLASNHRNEVEFIHSLLDVESMSAGTFGDWMGVFEESFKVTSEAFFIGALLCRLSAVISLRGTGTPQSGRLTPSGR